MKFKNFVFFTILSSIFFIFNGCDSKDKTKEEAQPKIFHYNLTTTDMKPIILTADENAWKFSGLEGKAVLLNFFATWCPPCKAEIPHLNNLREKYNGSFEIVAVLVENDKSNEQVQQFINEFSVTYPIVNSAENQKVIQAVGGVKSIPTMFLFNKDGKVINKYVGMVPEEMLDSEIQKALQ